MPNDHHRPITKAEHRAAYQEHRQRAIELYLDVSLGAIAGRNGGDLASAARFAEQLEEYHDELAAMSWHYTAAMLAEELEG